MESETKKEKENEVIPQNVGFSGYELGKLARLSKNLLKFLKGLDACVSVVQIKAVLSALADCYSEKYNCMFVRQESIMEEFDVSRKTVYFALKCLVDNGLLAVEVMEKDERRKVFCFTNKFFDIVLVDAQKIFPSKYVTRLPIKKGDMLPEVTYPNNITNNVTFLNNVKSDFQKKVSETGQKLPKYHSNVHITGRDYPKFTPKRQEKEEMSRGQALEFILNLPQKMQNFGIALQLREKWLFSVEELKPPD